MQLSHTPAGAVLTSCDMDATCAELDCDAVMREFGDALLGTPEGEDFLAHYCGLNYVNSDDSNDEKNYDNKYASKPFPGAVVTPQNFEK